MVTYIHDPPVCPARRGYCERYNTFARRLKVSTFSIAPSSGARHASTPCLSLSNRDVMCPTVARVSSQLTSGVCSLRNFLMVMRSIFSPLPYFSSPQGGRQAVHRVCRLPHILLQDVHSLLQQIRRGLVSDSPDVNCPPHR